MMCREWVCVLDCCGSVVACAGLFWGAGAANNVNQARIPIVDVFLGQESKYAFLIVHCRVCLCIVCREVCLRQLYFLVRVVFSREQLLGYVVSSFTHSASAYSVRA